MTLAKDRDALSHLSEAIDRQDRIMSLVGVKQPNKIEQAIEELKDGNKTDAFEEEVARIFEVSNPGYYKKKAQLLRQIPAEWLDEGLRRTVVRHALNQSCEALLAICDGQPKKDRDGFLQLFSNDKQQLSCAEFAAKWTKFFIVSLSHAKKAKAVENATSEVRSQLPPNALVSLEHLPLEEQIATHKTLNRGLRQRWEANLTASDGDPEKSIVAMIVKGLSFAGLDDELKEEMGIGDHYWPNAQGMPRLQTSDLTVEVRA